MEIAMWYRFSIVATAALLLGGAGAAAAELPTYEVMGFPKESLGPNSNEVRPSDVFITPCVRPRCELVHM